MVLALQAPATQAPPVLAPLPLPPPPHQAQVASAITGDAHVQRMLLGTGSFYFQNQRNSLFVFSTFPYNFPIVIFHWLVHNFKNTDTTKHIALHVQTSFTLSRYYICRFTQY